jgi:transcriptional regulator with XRE-family HTH domain
LADETTERRRLGRELRKARQAAKLTQAAVAEALGCGQAKVNKIENTLVEIDAKDLDRMLELYQPPADKAGEIRALAPRGRRRRRRTSLPPMSKEFAHLVEFEMDAVELLSLHSERIPGPLQAEQYVLRQSRSYARTTAGVVELLEHRRTRAEIFTMARPPRYRVILSESSLLRLPGGRSPDLELEQSEHLLGLAMAHEHIELHVLPFTAPAGYVGGDFVLAMFGGKAPDFGYLEYPGGAYLVNRPNRLAELRAHWDELCGHALSTSESLKFLNEVAENARREWHIRRDNS